MTLSTLLLALLSLTAACDAELDDMDMDSDMDMDTASAMQALDPCSDALAPTWDNFGEAFTLNWCQGCHSAGLGDGQRSGAPEGIDFNAHTDVLEWRDRIESRAAAETPSMPPTGGPSEAELALLRQWLVCGAP